VLHDRTTDRLPWLARLYVIVPYVALVGHLLACTWVFKLPFYAACYAPVLLGLAVVAGMTRDYLGRVVATNLEWSFAAVAVMLAMGASPDLTIAGSHHHWAALTALRVTLLAAGAVNLHGLIALRHPLFAVTLTVMAVGALLGPTLHIILANVRAMYAILRDLLQRLIPRTAPQWGVVTVGGAFVLLAIGAIVSLFTKHPHRREEATA
jgi:hypothetical protein